MEPDRQALIERIVKLQKRNMKHMEKIEFLEEHVNQLLTEVKKKNRVIQHYVLREQSGALSSKNFDEHKVSSARFTWKYSWYLGSNLLVVLKPVFYPFLLAIRKN